MEAVFKVQISPKAKRSTILGIHGDAIKIQIAAPPVEGRANDELISFLAKKIGVKKADVTIKSGGGSKIKIIAVSGMTTEKVKSILLDAAEKK